MEGALRRRTECIKRRFSIKMEKDGFLQAVVMSRFQQKIPVTEFLLVCCDCVLFSMAKSSVRVFVSVARTF